MWLSLLIFELKHYIKNIYELIYIYSFFIIILLIFVFTASSPQALLQLGQVPGMVALSLCVMLAGSSCFEKDASSGLIEQVYLSCGHMLGYVAAKFTALILIMILPLLSGLWLLPHAGFAAISSHFSYFLAGVGLLSCVMLSAAITSGIRRAGAMLQLIVLPWMIPVLVFWLDSTSADAPRAAQASTMLLAICGVLAPCALLIASKVLKKL